MTINPSGVVTIEVGPASGPPSSILALPVNPDQSLSQDIRVTAIQTLVGAYFDDFGLGLTTLQLSGTTAFNSPQGKFNGRHIDGNEAAHNLYKNIIAYYFQREESVKGSTVMHIYDDAFGQSWQVKPIGQLQLSRVSSDPLVLRYSQNFIVIQDLMMPFATQPIPDPVQVVWKSPTNLKNYTGGSVAKSASKTTSIKQTPDFVYVVQSGDSLWTIAQRYLPKQANNTQIANLVNAIVAKNRLRNENLIFEGERLTIPA